MGAQLPSGEGAIGGTPLAMQPFIIIIWPFVQLLPVAIYIERKSPVANPLDHTFVFSLPMLNISSCQGIHEVLV